MMRGVCGAPRHHHESSNLGKRAIFSRRALKKKERGSGKNTGHYCITPGHSDFSIIFESFL
jgi:hypothetical protein